MKTTLALLTLLSVSFTSLYAQSCDDFTNTDEFPTEAFIENDTIGYFYGGTQAIILKPSIWGTGSTHVNNFSEGIYVVEFSIDFEFDGSSKTAIFERYGYSGADTEEGFSVNGSDTIYLDETFPMTIDGVTIDLDDSAPDYDGWNTDYLIFSGEIDDIKLVGVEFGIKNICIEEFIVDEGVGLENTTMSATKIYPNPSQDYLEIKREKKINRIEIYSMTGELLIEVDKINSTQTKINIEYLDNGAYFLKVYDKSGSETATKFLKN